MKGFLKSFIASLLAFVLGSGCLVFFLFFGFMAMIAGLATWGDSLSSSAPPVELRAHTVLKVDAEQLSEIATENPFASFSGAGTQQPISLTQAIRAIHLAKDNPNIDAIYLHVEGMVAGMASVDELRRALLDFKKSGKPIIAYGDSYTQKAYYLASVADQVCLNPVGGVHLTGIAAGMVMYKGALDKLGIKMEVFKVGTFKSAVEPYIANQMSEANRLQMQEYVDGLWEDIVTGIAKSRKLTPDVIRTFANEGRAYGAAADFVAAKFVDTLIYRTEVKSLMAKRLKLDEQELRMISLADMARQPEPDEASKARDFIQVLYAEGEILDEAIGSPMGFAGASTIGYGLVDDLNAAAEREDVRAVVLRINSPGGSAFLSDQIWHAVKKLREKKPVVVSMGDYAASGGYYIASAANKIVAEPLTLTGSIGIFGLLPDHSELTGKLGITLDLVKTSTYADLERGLGYHPFTAEQRGLIQGTVERGYRTFLKRVADGRKMTELAVDSVGQGRIWLGKTAKKLGLVDTLGGLSTAIAEAAELADLSDYRVDYGATSRNPFSELFSSMQSSDDFVARLRWSFMTPEERRALRLVQGITQYSGVQARLPYEVQGY